MIGSPQTGTTDKCRDAFAKLAQYTHTIRSVSNRAQELLGLIHDEPTS